MDIIMRARGVELDAGFRGFLRENLERALRRFDESIVSIDVFVADLNGPKGGNDKHILIRVRLTTGAVLATETTRSDFYSALKVGVATTRRSVNRAVKRAARLERRAILEGRAELTATS